MLVFTVSVWINFSFRIWYIELIYSSWYIELIYSSWYIELIYSSYVTANSWCIYDTLILLDISCRIWWNLFSVLCVSFVGVFDEICSFSLNCKHVGVFMRQLCINEICSFSVNCKHVGALCVSFVLMKFVLFQLTANTLVFLCVTFVGVFWWNLFFFT